MLTHYSSVLCTRLDYIIIIPSSSKAAYIYLSCCYPIRNTDVNMAEARER